MAEQPRLHRETPSVTCEIARDTDHSMARDYDPDRISAVGEPDGSRGTRPPDPLGYLTVGRGRPERIPPSSAQTRSWNEVPLGASTRSSKVLLCPARYSTRALRAASRCRRAGLSPLSDLSGTLERVPA